MRRVKKKVLVVENDRVSRDLAKIDAGKIDINSAPTDVAAVIAEVESALHPLAREKRIVMETEIDRSLPEAHADAARLRQVLFNLVANAIKFTPEAGRVGIDATLRDGSVVVAVTDTGPGLRPGEAGRIFEPYERGQAGQTEEGAGLGLSLARSLIELQGGRIWVESVPDHGSTFFLSIPAVATKRRVAQKAAG